MAALPQLKTYLTPEEYLADERQAETKSEYWQGETFSLAGASRQHNLTTANLTTLLNLQLKGRWCEVYAGDMRVKVARATYYTYPDVTVVCGKPSFEDRTLDTLLNPTVIIEVLSPSTEAYDRGAKFEFYQLLESLTDYLLVAQERPSIDHFARQPDGRWLLANYHGMDAVAAIPSIGCELRLVDVFDKVEWPTETARQIQARAIREELAKYGLV
jgi:Uma2 family endonuclease